MEIDIQIERRMIMMMTMIRNLNSSHVARNVYDDLNSNIHVEIHSSLFLSSHEIKNNLIHRRSIEYLEIVI